MSFPSNLTHHRDTYPAISPTQPALSEAGKTVLITGGAQGLGFEIARSFAKASASRIIILSRKRPALDAAIQKLRDEFQSPDTSFISQVGDMADDVSITALWDYLHSQKIFVHVLVLNAATLFPLVPDTLSIDKKEFMEAFDINVGGNFLMTAKFVKQPLRPVGQQLKLVNVSTAAIQRYPAMTQTPYTSSKAAFTTVLGRIAYERSVEDVQIISYHPGLLYTEGAQNYFAGQKLPKWDEMALPADFSVWAASPEASWLHGRFVWAHWDVDELKADKNFANRLQEEPGFLKVAIQGLGGVSIKPYYEE
ncbi:short-chain dehydrogenase/reductase [Lentinula raphanica]|uniref:Short-chain dehydrogenase/reductase n=1 Tax=Lentinula raphanica TaxID=153919 RepID=A0AA38U9S8_9AGAR|nr:short-chain dehydrogenase/reductase [Lentinula raphanica]KAJ3819080.1 short-chain dehydrogenase/reductase [Lentinula raphanica]KAJ3834390.1 short-chain dehydrogenase/reductase [Lentinula raphanica]KAJ3968202.1 short-chain dehydrogenase/reductase [Lentinula raphanica]